MQEIVAGCGRLRSAQIVEARAKADYAKLKLKPHVFYGAMVFKTQGPNVSPDEKWTCANMAWFQELLDMPTHPGVPHAKGPSPKAACEAFDRLWEEGSHG